MKRQYERCGEDSIPSYRGKYRKKWAGQYRYVRTMNEIRQLAADENEGIRVRRRRLNVPTVYDDITIVRNYGRSWKDFTRRRHQWDRD